MSFDVERGLISKLLQTKDLETLKTCQIKLSFFTGESRNAFRYIYDCIMKTGEVPTVRAFRRKFPKYSLEIVDIDGEEKVGTEENLKYWCTELRAKVRHNTLADGLEEAASELRNLDTTKALSLIKKTVIRIETDIEETRDIDITKDSEARIESYKKRKISGGILGISTGFKHLDFMLRGLVDGTLTTVIAKTGIGKTWFEVLIGATCMLNGYRVLQIVTEMSEEIMQDRYDAVLFSKCYTGFSYNAFKSGKLPPDTEKQYFTFLREDLPEMESLFIATVSGVMGVRACIEKYNPDLVMIDSVYLMEDDEGAKDDWLRVAHITRGLKKLAHDINKPILINTQADKNTSKKTGPELESIMYTQAVGQDSDNILALYRDEVMLSDREMGIKILKQREGSLGKMTINWDFDKMDFSEIYMEKNDEDDSEEISDNTLHLHDKGGN